MYAGMEDPMIDYSEWSKKGDREMRKGDFSEAVICYTRALQECDDDHITWCNKGVALTRLNRNGEALECFRKSVALNPDYIKGWESMANMFARLARNEEALRCCDEVLRRDRSNKIALYYKACCEDDLGRTSMALESYGRFLDAASGDTSQFVDYARRRIGELERRT
jgi:tetratricopeptide (TPR) repeat protein